MLLIVLFSHSLIYIDVLCINLEPIKFPSNNLGNEICDRSEFGPCFGNGKDLGIFVKGSSYSSFPKSYQDILGKGRSIFTGNSSNSTSLKLKDVEAFQLFK